MEPLNARRVALAALVILILYLCWLIIAPFVQILLWAGVLAIVAHPVYQWLRRRGRGANLAAMLTTLGVVLTFVVPVVLIAMVLWNEASNAAPAVDQQIRRVLDRQSAPYQFVDRFVDLDRILDPDTLSARLAESRRAVLAWLVSGVGSLLTAVAQAVLVAFALFYFIRDGEQIMQAIRRFAPMEEAQSQRMLDHIYKVISASVYGVLFIAAVQGALGGIAFAVLGIASPVLWGTVMFLLSMIPLAGSFIVWGPVAVFLLVSGHELKGIGLILWGVLVIGMLDNILRPRLVGRKSKLHELIVFFSVLGGLQVFGMLGVVAGPVVAAMGLAMLEMFLQAPGEPVMGPDGAAKTVPVGG